MKQAKNIFISPISFIIFIFFIPSLSTAQEIRIDRIEPPFWWTGFKNPNFQLLVYGKNIAQAKLSLTYPGLVVKKIIKVINPNYLFIDLEITSKAVPGKFVMRFTKGNMIIGDYEYELKARVPGSAGRKGFGPEDVIYLAVPDRFANGDTTNDNLPGMNEPVNRSNPDGRHGGDIKGIASHISYLKELGVTSLWLTPVFENNMVKYSYHGYSITDYYKIDPRFGTNEDYRNLSDSLHKNGMKLIMDMVFNHCGSYNWWMEDLPSPDWLNQFPTFTRTSYRTSTQTDPYVSEYDSIKLLKGWFDVTMPDLNQHNPYLGKYLIQNSIWWTEYAGLDGIRQDTYPYAFKDFMSEWDKAVLTEYPDFNIVGECWSTTPNGIAYWQKNARNRDGYNSYLPSVFDFAMYDALRLGFMEQDGWSTGILRLYEILSQDFIYPDPSHIVIFADSHDVDRYLNSQQGDIRKLKMALIFVLTSRGIPEMFYGTEVLMTTGKNNGDGYKRKDFPGGWPGDSVNAFTGTGLSAQQSDMKQFLTNLLNWRKGKEVIHIGKLKHFMPKDGLYVYFRYNEKETVMIAFNNNQESRRLDPSVYNEFLDHFHSGRDIISGKMILDLSNIAVPPKEGIILELKK